MKKTDKGTILSKEGKKATSRLDIVEAPGGYPLQTLLLIAKELEERPKICVVARVPISFEVNLHMDIPNQSTDLHSWSPKSPMDERNLARLFLGNPTGSAMELKKYNK